MNEKKKSFKGFMLAFEGKNKRLADPVVKEIFEIRDGISNQIVRYLREAIESLKKANNECNSFDLFKKEPKSSIDTVTKRIEKIIREKNNFWQSQEEKK